MQEEKLFEIIEPKVEDKLDQDEEFYFVETAEGKRKFRFHDYDEIYKIPGLYEAIFYEKLKCNSPVVITEMMGEEIEQRTNGINKEDISILDFGAGNGIVAKELKNRGFENIVGVDILSEAKMAAERDYPGVYTDYYDFDLGKKENMEALKKYNFDLLVTVAALGYDDIPPLAFYNAFDLVKNGGWVAFNIRDKFVKEEDDTGYHEFISWLSEDSFEIHSRKKYCHRLSITGEKLMYEAIVGQKLQDIEPPEFLDEN